MYDKHANNLIGYARKLVPGFSKANAEDAVQETFVLAITYAQSNGPIDAPLGFLITSLRNVINSTFYRGRRNTHTDSYDDDGPHLKTGRRFGTSHQVDIAQRLAVFQAGIEAIPHPAHREVFVRKKIYGQSATEIADSMGFKRENTVYNYAVFGWKSLKKYVELHGYSVDDFFEDAA